MNCTARPVGILLKHARGVIVVFALLGATNLHAASDEAKSDAKTHGTPSAAAASTNLAPVDAAPAPKPDDSTDSLIARALSKAAAAITNAAPGAQVTISDDDDDDDSRTVKKGTTKIVISSDKHDQPESVFSSVAESIIPLVAIVTPISMPVFIVFIFLYFRHRRREANLSLAREFLAKGMPVPPQLLEGRSPEAYEVPSAVTNAAASRGQMDTRKGIKLIFIGLAVTVALYVGGGHSTMWGWGLIPTVIGIGYLVAGMVDNRGGGGRNDPPPGTLR